MDVFDKLFLNDWSDLYPQIAAALAPYVRLESRGNPTRVWLPVNEELTVAQRVYIALLLHIVERALGIRETNTAAPAELEAELGIEGNSIRPALRRMEARGYIRRVELGQYEVRFPRIVPVVDIKVGAA